jgi:hypothetical protein
MGRQYRAPRQGQFSAAYTVTKASSTVATVPTGGLVILSTVVGGDFSMMAPEQGVRTQIYVNLVTTGGLAVRACTKGGTGSFSSTAADCVLKFDKAGPHLVSLLGVSSTQWAVEGITPVSTAVITTTTI